MGDPKDDSYPFDESPARFDKQNDALDVPNYVRYVHAEFRGRTCSLLDHVQRDWYHYSRLHHRLESSHFSILFQ